MPRLTSTVRKLTFVIALIGTLGTIGCGSTRQAGSTSSTASTANTTGNQTSTPTNQSATPPSQNVPQQTGAVLSASNSSLNFGNVRVGGSTSQIVSLTNTGAEIVNVLSVSASGSGFSTSNGTSVTLAPNQSENVYVNFVPASVGASSGAVTIASNASNPVISVNLSGSGVDSQEPTHSVNLSWTPSSSNVVGYNVERSTTFGGPYTQVSGPMEANANYTDTTVNSGTYYYVVTAVDSQNNQSPYSNQVQVIVP